MFNIDTMHMWVIENPHAIDGIGYQYRFSINVWCGIVGNYLIGSLVLSDSLTAPA
jgi:outer membrane protease